MKTAQTLAAFFGLVAMAHAHMEMTSPAPFKSKNNPNAGSDVDYSMTSPLSPSGDNFPCKGYHTLFGTPEGKPTAEWAAGSSQSFTIDGGANHGGGSCQASLSYDGGSTWNVIHSYIGNCPPAGQSTHAFTVPSDAPSGDAIFAWTWFNNIGNREMYMNCAAVTVTGGSSSKRDLSSLPAMFVANVGNGCSTAEGSDVAFPNPGQQVDDVSAKTAAPVGNCPAGNSGGSAPSNPEAPASSAAPAPAPPASSAAPVSSSAAAPAPPAAPTTVPGGVFLTAPPAQAPTEAPVEAPVAPPSTLITATRSAEAPAVPTAPVEAPAQPEQPEQPEQPSAPAPTPTPAPAPVTPPVTPPSPPTGGAGGFTAGEACTEEGIFNCVGGSQFQRCASGVWSVMMPVAAGTTCVEGQSTNLLRKRVYGQPLIRGRRAVKA